MTVNVTVTGAVSAEDGASVAGGGTRAGLAHAPVVIGDTDPLFGVASFSMQPFDADGGLSVQAGGHPTALVANIDFDTSTSGGEYVPPEELRDVGVELPLGLLGNPLAVPQCPLSQLNTQRHLAVSKGIRGGRRDRQAEGL